MSQSKARATLWNAINGATGVQVLSAGGAMGTANIAFTLVPTEGDTITVTVGSTATVFTFWETANVPGVDATVEIDIGANLAAALAAAETIIESNLTVGPIIGGAGVISNVDVTNTDADLSFTTYPQISGITIVSSTDGANTTDTAFSAGSVIRMQTSKAQVLTTWADASSTLTYLTLPDGTYDGQMLELYSVSETTAGDTVGVLGNFGSTNNLGTSVGAAADGATLYWNSGQWNVKVSTNFTLSATTAAAL